MMLAHLFGPGPSPPVNQSLHNLAWQKLWLTDKQADGAEVRTEPQRLSVMVVPGVFQHCKSVMTDA